MPDFRSAEKVFQLIYQASGRSGRGSKEGEVVIQTFSPKNPVIENAKIWISLFMKKNYLKEKN